MFLKRIELQGFKSFADKSVIQFDTDIIGVVGPNGCGKSNITDAIRWVLGEQSAKSLRGTSMSDVIFNGSTHRKPVNMAEVTLVFDNQKKFLNIEYEEVEITRRLYRQSGEAEYFINKTPCRLKDIQGLVMDSGLGKDSLSIISQGNISGFAEAKPEERRALFEEAAGVAKYKKRKNESLSKLERTQENLLRVEDIVNELERQVAPLAKQAKKAEIYIQKKQELEVIEVSVLVDEIEKFNLQMQEVEKKTFDLESKRVMYETTIQVEDLKIQELRKEASLLDRENQQLQIKQREVLEHKSSLEKKKVELDEKRKYALEHADAKEKAKELQSMLEETKFEYENRQERYDELNKNYEILVQNKEQIDNDLAFSYQEITQLHGIMNRLKSRKEVLENMKKQPFHHQRGVKAIMDAKQSLYGILGVISQLLQPEQGYEIAISSALGGSNYHIVSENEEHARHAITFLKKNNSGIATFLPLTVLHPRSVSQEHLVVANSQDGYLGVVADFVICDPKFDVLKHSLLGNVLICNNLSSANGLAKLLKYHYKIITLDGDIVHRGGSMTGGKDQKNTTPITIQKELEQVVEEITKQEEIIAINESRYDGLHQKKERLEADLLHTQLSLVQLQTVLESKKAKYESLRIDYEQIAPDNMKQGAYQADEMIVELSQLYSSIDETDALMKQNRDRRNHIGNDVERKEQQIRQIRRDLNLLQNEERELIETRGRLESRLESSMERLSATYEMTYEFASEQKIVMDMEEARLKVQELRQEIQRLGNVNLDAPQEYIEVKERFDFLTKQRDDLNEARAKILTAIDEMDELMVTQFSDTFHKINNELQGIFQALFGGGKAKLFMVNPEDILHTGIDIDVQPPGKTVQNIRLFSGGEKSLIAICVLFAILKARTMPLCIFDEVEAALDQANVERFAKYLAKFKDESQFIVVTHRPGTMEQCDELYGVTMQQNGVSQLLKVKLQDAINFVDKKGELH